MPDSLPRESLSGEHIVRTVTALDLPWVLSLAYERYGPYDPGKILVFLLDVLKNPDALFLRTDEAFMVASKIVPIWGGKPECHVVYLCAAQGAHWQAVKLLRRSVAWARAKQCWKWWFGSETDSDIGALAKRVGAQPTWPRYKMEL